MYEKIGYIPTANRYSKLSLFCYRIIRFILNIIIKFFFDIKIIGDIDYISDAMIIAPLHRSFWDIPVLGVILDRQSHFMGRKGVFRNPILRRIGYYIGSFSVDTEKKFDTKAYKIAGETLKNKRLLIIFPEGTRKKDGELGELFPGVPRLAKKYSCPIVPVGIHYSAKNGFRRRTISIEYLDQIKINENKIDETLNFLKLGYSKFLSQRF